MIPTNAAFNAPYGTVSQTAKNFVEMYSQENSGGVTAKTYVTGPAQTTTYAIGEPYSVTTTNNGATKTVSLNSYVSPAVQPVSRIGVRFSGTPAGPASAGAEGTYSNTVALSTAGGAGASTTMVQKVLVPVQSYAAYPAPTQSQAYRAVAYAPAPQPMYAAPTVKESIKYQVGPNGATETIKFSAQDGGVKETFKETISVSNLAPAPAPAPVPVPVPAPAPAQIVEVIKDKIETTPYGVTETIKDTVYTPVGVAAAGATAALGAMQISEMATAAAPSYAPVSEVKMVGEKITTDPITGIIEVDKIKEKLIQTPGGGYTDVTTVKKELISPQTQPFYTPITPYSAPQSPLNLKNIILLLGALFVLGLLGWGIIRLIKRHKMKKALAREAARGIEYVEIDKVIEKDARGDILVQKVKKDVIIKEGGQLIDYETLAAKKEMISHPRVDLGTEVVAEEKKVVIEPGVGIKKEKKVIAVNQATIEKQAQLMDIARLIPAPSSLRQVELPPVPPAAALAVRPPPPINIPSSYIVTRTYEQPITYLPKVTPQSPLNESEVVTTKTITKLVVTDGKVVEDKELKKVEIEDGSAASATVIKAGGSGVSETKVYAVKEGNVSDNAVFGSDAQDFSIKSVSSDGSEKEVSYATVQTSGSGASSGYSSVGGSDTEVVKTKVVKSGDGYTEVDTSKTYIVEQQGSFPEDDMLAEGKSISRSILDEATYSQPTGSTDVIIEKEKIYVDRRLNKPAHKLASFMPPMPSMADIHMKPKSYHKNMQRMNAHFAQQMQNMVAQQMNGLF